MKSIYKNYRLSKQLIPDMEYAVNQLTANQEGFGSFIMSVSNFFKKKIDSIAGVFGINSKNDTKEISKETSQLYKELSKFDNGIKKIVKADDNLYKSLGAILLPWIPGVKPDLYNLVAGLKVNVDGIKTKALPYLEEADTFISKLIGDEDYRTSIIPNKELIEKLKSYSKETTSYLTDIIDGRLLADSRELKDVIPNLESIDTIHVALKDMIAAKDIENVQVIFNAAGNIATKAKELFNMVQKNSLTISKVRANEMGPVLQEAATIVTNVAAIVRMLDASVKVHKAILIKLDSIIK
nr:MAG TPA: hypothetical protein [Caudoviricetes sp.]